ncbi:MAG: hypothetical protein DRQ42_05815 [Gammaproteobacteria bacterium]|nr:MAG: hypothetical protein DRQ42_05815 [Gammaproteobacteria bacterium]
MNFNPQKPYAKIMGNHAQYPGARFQQGILLYDAHRKCLNPKEVEGYNENAESAVDEATLSLKKKVSKEADAALRKLEQAKAAMETKATPASKSAYTKALKAYEKAQTKLEGLS